MSLESLRSDIQRLQSAKQGLDKKALDAHQAVSSKEKEISSLRQDIAKATSESSRKSKESQLQSKTRDLLSLKKRAIDADQAVANKNAEILKKLSELDKQEQAYRKKIDADNKKKQDEQSRYVKKQQEESKKSQDLELKHIKNMNYELEKQSRLHRELANKVITVDIAKLPEKITVLFIASNPLDQSKLALDEEIRSIEHKIKLSEYRNAVQLKSIWATRPDDLLQAMNEHEPTIIHFSGHGSTHDELVLQSNSGEAKLVKISAIVSLMKIQSDTLKLVVFNTCYSLNQAKEVSNHIPAAIGMNTAIGDKAARVFSAQLYSAIGFGKDISTAFQQAKVALMLEGIQEEKTPELYLNDQHDSLILVRPE